MRILIVEDELKIATSIKKGLEISGYAADMVHDSENALSYGLDPDYDLIIMDRMLPGGMDGLDVINKLRERDISIPILVLTAKGTINDRVDGLNIGADDYLVKPFAFDELLARIKALLRRPVKSVGTILKVSNLELNPGSYEVKRSGNDIQLAAKEFSLLEYMMRHPNQILTKDAIITHVWDGDSDILPNTVEVYIGYLRNKIDKPFSKEQNIIKTVRGFGYKLSSK
ncbi:MAG: response regulator transcription factor [bacterium]